MRVARCSWDQRPALDLRPNKPACGSPPSYVLHDGGGQLVALSCGWHLARLVARAPFQFLVSHYDRIEIDDDGVRFDRRNGQADG